MSAPALILVAGGAGAALGFRLGVRWLAGPLAVVGVAVVIGGAVAFLGSPSGSAVSGGASTSPDGARFTAGLPTGCGSWDTLASNFTVYSCFNAIEGDSLDAEDAPDPFLQGGLFTISPEVICGGCGSNDPGDFTIIDPSRTPTPRWAGPGKVFRVRRDQGSHSGGPGQDASNSVIQLDSSYVVVWHLMDSTRLDNENGHYFSQPPQPRVGGFQVTMGRRANQYAVGELTIVSSDISNMASINGNNAVLTDSSCFGSGPAAPGCAMLTTGTWYEIQSCQEHISATAYRQHIRIYTYPDGVLVADDDNFLGTDYPWQGTLASAYARGESMAWDDTVDPRRSWYIGSEGGQRNPASGTHAYFIAGIAVRSAYVDCTSGSRWFPRITK